MESQPRILKSASKSWIQESFHPCTRFHLICCFTSQSTIFQSCLNDFFLGFEPLLISNSVFYLSCWRTRRSDSPGLSLKLATLPYPVWHSTNWATVLCYWKLQGFRFFFFKIGGPKWPMEQKMVGHFLKWLAQHIKLKIVDILIVFDLSVWFDSLRPINNLSIIKGRVFLGWTSTKLGLMFLLKDTTQWGSNPRPLGLESSTLPLSHCAPYIWVVYFTNTLTQTLVYVYWLLIIQ